MTHTLTDEQIDNLSLDELRVEVAKERGWTHNIFCNSPWQMVPPGGDGSKVMNCPDYSRDSAACAELREQLKHLNLYRAFLDALARQGWRGYFEEEVNPDLQCRAYLKAIRTA